MGQREKGNKRREQSLPAGGGSLASQCLFAMRLHIQCGMDWVAVLLVVLPVAEAAGPKKRAGLDVTSLPESVKRPVRCFGDVHPVLRRLPFDLTGLLSGPEAMERFAAAFAKDAKVALEAKVDELLASPHFGERWGRHWLELARYADISRCWTGFPADRCLWPCVEGAAGVSH